MGDRINTANRLAVISPLKKTRLGTGHFWTVEEIYRNQDSEVVALGQHTLLGYRRDGPAPQGAKEA